MISVEHILSRRLTAFNAVKGKAYPVMGLLQIGSFPLESCRLDNKKV
ncbi:hypothetical protein Halhy_0535 [Haliscomenobacter hydrossis DSM 1100]|uniref:Uncharacterized protein n=1 Tax=Haliscomenobacter hydrossis (strain ATCC 27775 / DSM 1100 / LMG 10767 / O) TaxID=760192 RepID=F4KZF0_HALH1|nr:hypothetical protein Halhy_0535 [Haliscomenobacter hydrossis DSM 1100]